jgi:hypothetical protein
MSQFIVNRSRGEFLAEDGERDRSLVRIKRRTIVVYRHVPTGEQRQIVLTDEAAQSFRRISSVNSHETKVLYLVRCSPRRRQ